LKVLISVAAQSNLEDQFVGLKELVQTNAKPSTFGVANRYAIINPQHKPVDLWN
jgi:hypothetical protein